MPQYKLIEDKIFYKIRHKESGKFWAPSSYRATSSGKVYTRPPSLAYISSSKDKRNEWEVVKYMMVEIVPDEVVKE